MAKASPVTPHQREEERLADLRPDGGRAHHNRLPAGRAARGVPHDHRGVHPDRSDDRDRASPSPSCAGSIGGTLRDLEYGTGKLEQIANLVIGLGMLGGSFWIFYKAVGIIAGSEELGTPFGLALAAIVGAVNLAINVVAWDGMRRAAEAESSLVMLAQ
jgi:Predicted Co/Zn/Cd cation transporters